MTRQGERGLAHLVGSVPLDGAEAVFRRVLGALAPELSRVPDGETGERRRWIYWQRTMLESHPAREVDREAGLLELRQWDGSLLRRAELLRFKPGVDPATVDFPTGYAEAATESWRLFERLRRAGVVPEGVRFQVCLPTPMSSAFMYVSPRSRDAYLPAYERALVRALDRISATVPHADLSIQWDICQEVLVFEGYFPTRPEDYKERIVTLLGRLGGAVPPAVELGYHLCYGDPALSRAHSPRRRAGRPAPYRRGAGRRAVLRCRDGMRVGARRPGAVRRAAGKPPERRLVPEKRPFDPRRFLLIFPGLVARAGHP